MIISPKILRKDIVHLLTAVDKQIAEVTAEAERLGVEPETMRDADGNWVMVPLLLAKVQGLVALTQLNDSGKT